MAVDLGKQVGPLPLGAWVAVVGTGLGIAYYTRRSGPASSQTAEVVEDIGGQPGVGTGMVGGWIPTGPTSTTSVDTAPTNNEEWARLAINYLIAQGYDAAMAYSAITKAMAGGTGDNKMSIQEYALWRTALMRINAPPVPVSVPPPSSIPIPKPPVVLPKPKPPVIPRPPIRPPVKPPIKRPPAKKPPVRKPAPPTPKKAAVRYATVQRWPLPGSSLSSLAVLYYRDAKQWPRIFAANRYGTRRADGSAGMVRNPNLVQPGWKLVIPR